MLPRLILFWLLIGALEAKSPNILLICVDDLRPELKCYGVDYIHSPNIDALANKGRAFTSHYVQAPTCGASRYTLLTGTYGPGSNKALMTRSKKITNPSLPAYFRQNGYLTVSVGKISHYPGGRGGPNWDEPNQPEMPHSWDRHLLPAGPWQHPRGWMHGLAHGEIRVKGKPMDVIQALEGEDEIYPDGLSVQETLKQLKLLSAQKKPFFLATGLLRPHLPFGAPARYLNLYRKVKLPPIPHPSKPSGKTTYRHSGEFKVYHRWEKDPNTDPEFATEIRKHYAACVSYADAQVGKIIQQLKALQLSENTTIVLWGDHGWHLGEHGVWGKHTLFEESLRSPLIIVSPEVTNPGKSSSSLAESTDIFPTLCDLAKLPKPDYLVGHSLLPQLKSPSATTRNHALSYYAGAHTLRTKTHRFIVHSKGFQELYHHAVDPDEKQNVAKDSPEITNSLLKILEHEKTKRRITLNQLGLNRN